jgi:glutamine cyclotransferase
MLVLDRNTLEKNREYVMPEEITEGWGVTADEMNISADGNYRLWVSDGTSNIFELNGDTMEIMHTRTVTD